MIIWVLVRKLLRDIRIAWIVVAVLLFLFQILWSRITQRVTSQILRQFDNLGVSVDEIRKILFNKDEMPGQMVQAIIGGDKIEFDRASDMMSISYVHPLVLTILTIWAIGRAANAIAGEIDRGTMELLLAQPIRRTQIILAHLLVDAIVFPSLCLAIWLGTYCGTWWMGLQAATNPRQYVDPIRFLPALPCIVGLLFSTSGMTMWISALGRSRPRVWGWGVSVNLTMFLINVLGQIWSEPLEWLRPFTIFYHYQPQFIISQADWYTNSAAWLHLCVLIGVGAIGYLGAWVSFCRRDLPAPL
jgi:ABC-2 type transport system permease protein